MDPVTAIATALGRIAQSAGDITSSVNQKKAAETAYLQHTALQSKELFKSEQPKPNNSSTIAIVVLAVVFIVLIVMVFKKK